jgi:hypothetical protein
VFVTCTRRERAADVFVLPFYALPSGYGRSPSPVLALSLSRSSQDLRAQKWIVDVVVVVAAVVLRATHRLDAGSLLSSHIARKPQRRRIAAKNAE